MAFVNGDDVVAIALDAVAEKLLENERRNMSYYAHYKIPSNALDFHTPIRIKQVLSPRRPAPLSSCCSNRARKNPQSGLELEVTYMKKLGIMNSI
jgi:hypothetical protein